MNQQYDVGDVIRLSARFTSASEGAQVDPETVTVKVKSPDGTVSSKSYGTDPEVVKDGTGLFSFELLLTAGGTWAYRWESTGSYAAATEKQVAVRPSAFDAG